MRRVTALLAISVFVLPVLNTGCKDDGGEGGYQPCTHPPSAPCNPHPSTGATGIPTDTDLSWSCGGSQCRLPVTYDVYLATYSPPSYHGSTAGKAYPLGRLEPNTCYYWRVVAKDDFGATDCPLWSFTTGEHTCLTPPTAPNQPSPADGASDTWVGSLLTWGGGASRCDLAVSYDVYLGSEPPLPRVATVAERMYDPHLSHSTHFYWKIVAKDDNGSTAGPEWEFITGAEEFQILGASLHLRINKENDSGSSFYAHRCTGSWDELSLTWRNAPGWESRFLDSGSRYTETDGSSWMEFSIRADLIEYWVLFPTLNDGIVIHDGRSAYPGYDTRTEFYSKESKSGCYNPDPYLEITWRPPGESTRVTTVYPSDDTWAYEVFPDAQRGGRATLWAGWGVWGGSPAAGNSQIYIRFDIRLQ